MDYHHDDVPPPAYVERNPEKYDDVELSKDEGEQDSYPPDYYTVMSENLKELVPGAATYEPPVIEGLDSSNDESTSANAEYPFLQRTQQSLMYADFLPRLTKEGNSISPPCFDNFRSLMNYVNWWLNTNPHFFVIRCESIERKISKEGVIETDSTIYHSPMYGNIQYIRGLRIWMVYRTASATEPQQQQLGYVNVLPKNVPINMVVRHGYHHGFLGAASGMTAVTVQFPNFENMDKTIKRFNEKLLDHPLPGKVLTIESIELKYTSAWEGNNLDADETFWEEQGSSSRLYLSMLRVFFTQGSPSRNKSMFYPGIEDFVPRVECLPPSMGFPRFEPFSNISEKASQWIYRYDGKDMKVMNIQTINVKVKTTQGISKNQVVADSKLTDFVENFNTQFVKTIRVSYIVQPPEEKILSEPLVMTTKLFVPARLDARSAESLPETMHRINTWLQYQKPGLKIIGADTLKFEFSPSSKKLKTEEISYIHYQNKGHYWMTAIRLYFNGHFTEPMLPPVPVIQNEPSSCCNIF